MTHLRHNQNFDTMSIIRTLTFRTVPGLESRESAKQGGKISRTFDAGSGGN
jgi:hypothetical protein